MGWGYNKKCVLHPRPLRWLNYFLLFYMCHSTMGLTCCYTTVVFVHLSQINNDAARKQCSSGDCLMVLICYYTLNLLHFNYRNFIICHACYSEMWMCRVCNSVCCNNKERLVLQCIFGEFCSSNYTFYPNVTIRYVRVFAIANPSVCRL